MRIYLIGMPGVGKSTLGPVLAKKLGYSFIDIDKEIAKNQSMSINTIFERYGEERFRHLEKQALNACLEVKHAVIACGGGITKDKENKKLMKGKIVLLELPIDLLETRVKQGEQRPLLKNNSLDKLYEQRRASYESFADIKVVNENRDEAILEILRSLI